MRVSVYALQGGTQKINSAGGGGGLSRRRFLDPPISYHCFLVCSFHRFFCLIFLALEVMCAFSFFGFGFVLRVHFRLFFSFFFRRHYICSIFVYTWGGGVCLGVVDVCLRSFRSGFLRCCVFRSGSVLFYLSLERLFDFQLSSSPPFRVEPTTSLFVLFFLFSFATTEGRGVAFFLWALFSFFFSSPRFYITFLLFGVVRLLSCAGTHSQREKYIYTPYNIRHPLCRSALCSVNHGGGGSARDDLERVCRAELVPVPVPVFFVFFLFWFVHSRTHVSMQVCGQLCAMHIYVRCISTCVSICLCKLRYRCVIASGLRYGTREREAHVLRFVCMYLRTYIRTCVPMCVCPETCLRCGVRGRVGSGMPTHTSLPHMHTYRHTEIDIQLCTHVVMST